MASGSPGKPVVDPFHNMRDLQIPHAFTKKTNAKDVLLGQNIGTATNTRVTFHDLRTQADYSVPSGKELLIYKEFLQASLVTSPVEIGYGDDGVAEGTTSPTNEIFPANALAGTLVGQMHPITIDVTEEFSIPYLIPADKFPLVISISTTQGLSISCYAVERDV